MDLAEPHKEVTPPGRWRALLSHEGAAGMVLAFGVAAGLLFPVTDLALGPVRVVLLPISAAFVAALSLNFWLHNHLGPDRHARVTAGYSASLQILLLPFIAKLGALVGQAQSAVLAAGPALILQEAGHFLGTLALSMPIAIFVLKLGREAVGASFSVARETSVAIIAERYGIRSPEGNGVMAVYVAGTLFGTIIFSILASVIASLGLFDYRALAVACGVGSGSMTAACGGSLAALQPELEKDILGLAAASNLLSSISGFYLTLFVTLPLANWLYRLARGPEGGSRKVDPSTLDTPDLAAPYRIKVAIGMAAMAISVILMSKAPLLAAQGLGWLGLITLLALGFGRVGGKALPAAFWASILGALSTWPGSFASPFIAPTLEAVDMLVLAIAPLAAAALALGEGEWRAFRTIGWKLLIVALLVFVGTFLGAAIVAQLTFGAME